MTKARPFKQVRIDQDTYDSLVVLAADMRVSVTWLINKILRDSLST